MQNAARPNVLLIVTDQQRYDTIVGRSGCRMPHLDALAARGMVFDRAYTPVALCCPARAALQSGAFGWHNGVLNQVHVRMSVSPAMRPDVVTYAQRLAAAGYRNAYVGKWHADHTRGPLDLGYHRCSSPFGQSAAVRERAGYAPEDYYDNHPGQDSLELVRENIVQWAGGVQWRSWQEWDGPIEARQSAFTASRACHVMDELCEQAQPWLLEVHFNEPHDWFAPHVEYAKRYDKDDVPLPASWHDTFENKPGMNRKEARNYRDMTEEDARDAITHYWAYNEELDAQIGRVLDQLKANGQLDNTLVVATSDHGEMLGDHHMFLKGWMPYEGAQRIPMIAAWPGQIEANSSTDELVQLHDLAHTFCDVAGAEDLPFADGASLAPLLRGGSLDRDAILNVFYGAEFLYTQRTAITRDHKYVFNGFDTDELYDLQNDPHEMTNLIDEPAAADTCQQMQRTIHELMRQFDDPYAARGSYTSKRYLPGSEC